MNTLEISSSTKFDHIKIFLNQHLVKEQSDCCSIVVDIDDLPTDVSVEFTPFKLKPLIRYNNFMINYWLADILLQDHKLEFCITENFYQDYKNKDINGRIAHLSEDQKNIEHFYDKYIGINNLHPELVAEIKELIKQ